MKCDLDRIKKMYKASLKIAKDERLSRRQKKVFKQSFDFHKSHAYEKIKDILNSLNSAKIMWEARQSAMKEYFDAGVVDDTVVEDWKVSLDSCKELITKLDEQAEFLEKIQ
jgi:hypothetical protein